MFHHSCLILSLQVLVESEDPEMTLGVVDLLATDANAEGTPTVTYEIIKDG